MRAFRPERIDTWTCENWANVTLDASLSGLPFRYRSVAQSEPNCATERPISYLPAIAAQAVSARTKSSRYTTPPFVPELLTTAMSAVRTPAGGVNTADTSCQAEVSGGEVRSVVVPSGHC